MALALKQIVDPLAQEDRAPSGGGVENEAWFWVLIGVGIAGIGAAIAGIVVATQSGTTYPPYELGDDGAVHFTLTASVPFP